MPSTRNRVWSELAPRKNIDVSAPDWPVENAGAPGTPPSASLSELICWRARSAAEIWSTVVPSVCGAAGVRVAVTIYGASCCGAVPDESSARILISASAANAQARRLRRAARAWMEFVFMDVCWDCGKSRHPARMGKDSSPHASFCDEDFANAARKDSAAERVSLRDQIFGLRICTHPRAQSFRFQGSSSKNKSAALRHSSP